MDKPIAWYDPSNGMVSTDRDCPLFTPLGQVWGLYLKEEASASPKDAALRLALEALEYEAQKGNDNAYQFEREAIKAALETKEESWEKFCDSNCVWTDHHPDCKLAQPQQDGECKYCTDGCPICDARKLPKEAHDLL